MQRKIELAGIGEVTLVKRKGARNVRLSVGHDGQVRVSLPNWSPYKIGEAFALSRRSWIISQQLNRKVVYFEPGQRIGKGHRLRMVPSNSELPKSRLTKTELTVYLPDNYAFNHPLTQKAIRTGAVRALKQEAKTLLPKRVTDLSKLHDFSYGKITIKQLKSRWGSCSSQKDIALNCFLMQLPWELIDYVILHELLHTKIMKHGPEFWSELDKYVSNLAVKRKAIRAYQPILMPQA